MGVHLPDSERLLYGGRVRMGRGFPLAEAILIRNGRVAAVGREADVRATATGRAAIEDLAGATVTPGFCDAHVHLTAWALARKRVALTGSRSATEAAGRVAVAAGEGSGWLLGHGWNSGAWDELPTAEALDSVSRGRPVFLDSQDIHAAWLNSAALRLCGIDASTPDPPGGRIVRDARGEPTGLLLEAARAMCLARVPGATPAEVVEALAEAQAEAHRLGVTAVHSVEPTGLADFRRLEESGGLRLRVLQHIQLAQLEAAAEVGLRGGFGGDWIRIGGVKMFLDGALGSRTAWLREPYEGSDGDVGVQTLSELDFRAAVERAASVGLNAVVHAIGDAAVELALDVLQAVPAPGAQAHRIEHLQLCPPELWERAGASGVVGSMQPAHLLTDIPAAERFWGHDRSRGAYAFGSLLRAGMVLAFGSDVPVETLDPRPGLFAATRRQPWERYRGSARGDDREWYSEHRLTPAEAVWAYTEGPAHAAGWQDHRGRLIPGYDADLVVWNRDPVECTPDEYRALQAVTTIVGGEVVHRKEAG